jgi:nucleotide-binding universal stress UspA family protein
MNIETILAPTDLSTNSLPAMDFATRLAREHGAKLIFLHVLDPSVYDSGSTFMSIGERDQLFALHWDNAITWMNDKFTNQDAADLGWEALVVHQTPVMGILDTAQERGVNVIVMGTHGYSGLQRWMRGSVAEAVLREADCPVATVRPTGEVHDDLGRIAGVPSSEPVGC